MRVKSAVAKIALSCLVALGASQPAFAGLQVNLVYIENPPQPHSDLVTGGGQLREIMRVAAENWERIFRRGGGNWKVTIEYGWGQLNGSLYAQELKISETGNNPPRIGHSCVIFNTNPKLPASVLGFFADPTPWDNAEYLEYAAESVPTAYGWLNAARTFSGPTGDAIDRLDMLTIAMHEIGHALGLDGSYSGFLGQFPGYGIFEIKPPRPYAGFTYFINTEPHIVDLGDLPLMISEAPRGKRQLISTADALLIAQISLFDRPDLSEPSLDFNGDGGSIPTRSVASSPTCPVRPSDASQGQW